MAVRAEPVSPGWKDGPLMQWLTTVDHKRIGLLYIWSALLFFIGGGIMALLMRGQLAQQNESFLTENSYNSVLTMHGTVMVFLFGMPMLAGIANYLIPLMVGAKDMAFPRLNALSLWIYVFSAFVLLGSFGAKGGPASAGWTSYTPLSGPDYSPGVGQDLWILGLHLAGVSSILGRHQLPRHHRPHARARHDLDENPALRMGRLRPGAPHSLHRAGDRGSAPPAPARPPGRNELLRAGRWRQRGALSASLLVLRPPRGLHPRPARIRDHLRGHPGVRPEADLRLPGGRVLEPRDRVHLDDRLGPPHVHGRPLRRPQHVLHDRHLPRRHPDRRQDSQLGGDPVARQHQLPNADALRARDDRPLHHRGPFGHRRRHLPRRLPGARQLLRRRALPLHALRRDGVRDLRGALLLVPEDDGAHVQRAAREDSASGSCSSGST